MILLRLILARFLLWLSRVLAKANLLAAIYALEGAVRVRPKRGGANR
jgi:hypothetical protein